MSNNFKCPKCGKEFYVYKHSVSIVNGKTVNKDKSTGKELVCDVDQTPLEGISKFNGEAPYFAKIASMSTEDRKAVLQKRSSDHFQREIKENAHEMDKAMKKQLLGK